MLNARFVLSAVAGALIAIPAYAQEHSPGEDMASPSKPATAEEKQKARAARRAQGKSLAKEDSGRLEDPAVPALTGKTYTKQEKDAARADRRATGKELGKQDAGRLEDSGPTDKR
jgi:hypothetical protein